MAVPGERPQTEEARALETLLMEALEFVGVNVEELQRNLVGKETEFNTDDLWDIAFLGLVAAPLPGGKKNYQQLFEKLSKVKNPTPRQKEYLNKIKEILEEANKKGIDPKDVSHTVKFPEGFELPAKLEAVKQSLKQGDIRGAVASTRDAIVSKKERGVIGAISRQLPPPSDVLKTKPRNLAGEPIISKEHIAKLTDMVTRITGQNRDRVSKIYTKEWGKMKIIDAMRKARNSLKNKSTKEIMLEFGKKTMSAHLIILWGAMDLGKMGLSFYTSKLRENVRDGADPVEAKEQLEVVKRLNEDFTKFHKVSTIISPVGWVFGDIIMGIDESLGLSITNNIKYIEDRAAEVETGEIFEKTEEQILTELLPTITDPIKRAQIMKDLRFIKEAEEREANKSATRFQFAEDATGGELFVPPKPRDTDPPRPAGEVRGAVGPQALRAKEQPEREQPSKLGFGL